jgi:hypothetical protein
MRACYSGFVTRNAVNVMVECLIADFSKRPFVRFRLTGRKLSTVSIVPVLY